MASVYNNIPFLSKELESHGPILQQAPHKQHCLPVLGAGRMLGLKVNCHPPHLIWVQNNAELRQKGKQASCTHFNGGRQESEMWQRTKMMVSKVLILVCFPPLTYFSLRYGTQWEQHSLAKLCTLRTCNTSFIRDRKKGLFFVGCF